jgi:RHH-type proline utilization regulon transcriptional repressor/proline dehydrogenase/delta 1-pyrroline-5-carboxylate dehydrogenase
LGHGSFFPPTLIELNSLSQLTQEVFGPVLHLVRYQASELNQVIDAVNATGYGLTLGIHSRIDATINAIRLGVKVGNIYVNRNMIGAVVGVQPFGGMGLSGTGPKAGGPDYLRRFAIEQTVTRNTAAIGGNATLLAENLR